MNILLKTYIYVYFQNILKREMNGLIAFARFNYSQILVLKFALFIPFFFSGPSLISPSKTSPSSKSLKYSSLLSP